MEPIRITNQKITSEGWIFDIEIGEADGATKHAVELGQAYYLQLTNGVISPEELVVNSIKFLLERESKKAILRKFNLNKISAYFPEYEESVSRL